MLIKSAGLSTIHRAEVKAARALDDLALTVRIRRDWAVLRDFLSANYLVNPTFDPAVRTISPDSWWIEVCSGDRVVGVQAIAIYREVEFVEALSSGSLWWDAEAVPADFCGQAFDLPVHIAESWSHGGSMWVDPEWRDHRLAYLMTVLNRVRIFRDADVVWETGFVKAEMMNRRMLSYGIPPANRAPAFSGYLPFLNSEITLYGCWMRLEEALAQLADISEKTGFSGADVAAE